MGRINKQEKARRTALWVEQDKLCGMCSEDMPTVDSMFYVEEQNAIICFGCNQFRNVLLTGSKRGVTPHLLTAFLAKEPAQEPSPADTRKHKVLNHEQLQARYDLATGKMTLEDYENDPMGAVAYLDKRSGASGPVLDPDTGLEWAGADTN